jgi:hypothetical protein
VNRNARQKACYAPYIGSVTLLADAAQDHIVELIWVHVHPVDDLSEYEGRQVLRSQRAKGAAMAADRCSDAPNDHSFFHTISSFEVQF